MASFREVPKIMIVDDRAENLFALEKLLAPLGAEIIQARSGNEALTHSLNHNFALILLDVQMPEMDGFEVAEILRQEDHTKVTPIIFVTANSQTSEDMNRGYASGAVDYIHKPINDEVLLSKVRVFLEMNRVQRDLEAEKDALEMVVKAQQRTQHGTVIMKAQPSIMAGYRLLNEIGEGNVGAVYMAEKEIRGKRGRFALKILKAALKGKDSKAATRRFMQEAEAASRVDNPHVVTVVDFGVSEGQHVPYIVMEYIEGHTLKALIDRDALSFDDKISIIAQIANALDAIHAVGICHRDVKPGNIMIDRDNDFGIAKLPESDLTNADNLMGTLPYMAPEAFFSSDVDYRADFFSLGVLSYELLCGRRPFKGDNMVEIGNNICKLRPAEPQELAPEIPDEIQDVLANLLKKLPEHRFQRGAEVELALEKRRGGALGTIKRLLRPSVSHVPWGKDSELGKPLAAH